jgi:hypothetical protein
MLENMPGANQAARAIAQTAFMERLIYFFIFYSFLSGFLGLRPG